MLDGDKLKSESVETRFRDLFPGCGWPRTSYYTARTVWLNAGDDLRKQFIEAGRTPDGMWQVFKNTVRESLEER